MKRIIKLSLFRALVISVCFYLICVIYGAVSGTPYKTTLSLEIFFFLVMFVIGLIEYTWKDRKK